MAVFTIAREKNHDLFKQDLSPLNVNMAYGAPRENFKENDSGRSRF